MDIRTEDGPSYPHNIDILSNGHGVEVKYSLHFTSHTIWQRETERRRIEAEARCVEPDRREQGGAEQVAARRATAMLERARSERARRAEQERRSVLE